MALKDKSGTADSRKAKVSASTREVRMMSRPGTIEACALFALFSPDSQKRIL